MVIYFCILKDGARIVLVTTMFLSQFIDVFFFLLTALLHQLLDERLIIRQKLYVDNARLLGI